MKAVLRNGIAIRVLEEGRPDGPAMVFSNSLGTDLQVWDAVVPAFAGRFRIIRYDKRGHGLSDAPPAPYAIEDHVTDLAAVLDASDAREAVVVGLSVGGLIALGLAAARPELVRALVLCDTAHKIGSAQAWNARIDRVRAGGIEAMAEAILELWFSAAFRNERPGELAVWRNMLVRTPVEGYVGTCGAIRDADMTGAAGALGIPAICLGGSADGSTPPDVVRELASLITGCRFELIEGAGHLPCIEAPGEVVGVIEAFVEEHGLER